MENERKAKGYEIAFNNPLAVEHVGDGTWTVDGSRDMPYRVDAGSGYCTCPDYQKRHPENMSHRCKHFWAVFYTALEPVQYKVKPLDEQRYSIAITRMGVEFMRIGPFHSEGAANRGLVQLVSKEPERTGVA